MIDLQLPRPLMNPSLWPQGEAVLSIYQLAYGGPFTTRRGRSFSVPENFWRSAPAPSLVSVLKMAFQSGAEIVSQKTLSHAERAEWLNLGATSFRVEPNLSAPTLLEWSREIFPLTISDAGDVHWLRELREYESELGEVAPSLDAFRYWPAYLRKRGLFFAPLAAREWANAQAMFSPQGDSRGRGPDVLLNPTLQVVTDDREMHAVWRIEGDLASQTLDWQQAAVLDEMRETPLIAHAALINDLNSQTFTLAPVSTFEDVVNQLIAAGLLLRR